MIRGSGACEAAIDLRDETGDVKTFDHLYADQYFANRRANDPRRLASFLKERDFLAKHVGLAGAICDVGCSTGEFLEAIEWQGPRFGMEVNQSAMEEAQRVGISFERSILEAQQYFDVVIFRGTIQHLPDPFSYIGAAHRALKPGGHIAFLATPNANSIVYKLFNTLPALDPALNFYIPSDVTLSNVLRNYSFDLVDIEYPYLTSPYAQPIADHFKFIKALLTRQKPSFAFWRSMMNVIARKD